LALLPAAVLLAELELAELLALEALLAVELDVALVVEELDAPAEGVVAFEALDPPPPPQAPRNRLRASAENR